MDVLWSYSLLLFPSFPFFTSPKRKGTDKGRERWRSSCVRTLFVSPLCSLSVSSPKRERETRANPCLLTPSAVTRGGGGIELGDWLGIEDGEREDAPNPAFLYRYARVVYLAGMTRTRLPRQKKVLFVGNFLTDVIRSAGNQHAMGIIDLRSTRCTAVRAVLPVTVTYTCIPVLMPLLRRGQVLQNAAVRCKHWTGRRSRRGLLFP